MLVSDQKPYEVLNHLLTLNAERVEGYFLASKEIKANLLKDLFVRLTETSLVCRKELVDEVYKLGGTPQDKNTDLQYLNALRQIKTALQFNDTKLLLYSCREEEKAMLNNYEMALKDHSIQLTEQQNELIGKQYSLLQSDEEKVKNILNLIH